MSIFSTAFTTVKGFFSGGMSLIPWGKIVLCIALVVAGAAPTWYVTYHYEVNKYTAQIEEANTKAQVEITKLTSAKDAAESDLKDVKNEIQNKYEKNAAADAAVIAKLRADNKRLQFTTNQVGGSTHSNNPAGSSSAPATASTTVELPEQITNDLYSLANDADNYVEQLRVCEQWVDATKAALDKWKAENHIQ